MNRKKIIEENEEVLQATVSPEEVMKHLIETNFDIQGTLNWIVQETLKSNGYK